MTVAGHVRVVVVVHERMVLNNNNTTILIIPTVYHSSIETGSQSHPILSILL